MIAPLERYLLARNEPVSAEELTRNALKIPAIEANQARRLVASILAADERFVETEPGVWQLAESQTETPVCLLQLYPFQTRHFSDLFTVHLQPWPGDSSPTLYHTSGFSASEWAEYGKSLAAKLSSSAVIFNGIGNQRTRLTEWIGDSGGIRIGLTQLVPLAIDRRILPESQSSLKDPAIRSDDPSALFDDFVERWQLFADMVGDKLPACLADASRPLPDFDFSNTAFSAQDLAGLPVQPGVYIMRAENGKVLYVGKAANLHRRVHSYFRRPEASGKLAAIQSRIHALEIEPLGSELEALLREQQLIRELEPELNIQRRVQPRSARRRQRFPRILVLPHADPSLRNVVMLNPGAGFEWLTLEPESCSPQSIKSVLGRMFFRTVSESFADPREEMTVSWLVDNSERVHSIDMRTISSIDEAWNMLEPLLHETFDAPVIYRSSG